MLTDDPQRVRVPLELFPVPCDAVFPRTPCWVSKLLRVEPSAAGGITLGRFLITGGKKDIRKFHSKISNIVEGLRHHDLM